jgi:hypothetical protein
VLCLGSCKPAEDDWIDPTGDDDDPSDDDDSVPWAAEAEPGYYEGTTSGLVSFSGSGQYPCEGSVSFELDKMLEATGTLDCVFPHSGKSCSIDFEALEVDDGPEEFATSCYGEGAGSLSMWSTTDDQAGGRWHRSGDPSSVELNWNAQRTEEL